MNSTEAQEIISGLEGYFKDILREEQNARYILPCIMTKDKIEALRMARKALAADEISAGGTAAEPKPCPFCGSELRQNMQGAWEDTNESCILFGYELRDSEKSIEAWNRRIEK